MVEVIVSVAAKLAEYLVDPTLRQLQHLLCVSKISRNAEIKKEELILKQGTVQERVQEAINRTERIDGEVNTWKDDVESLIEEVENLEKELRANNGCLRGWCPTWRRYYVCKKLAKKIERMVDLNTKIDHFNGFSHPVIVPDIEYHHSSKNFKLFNSTQLAYDQLWEALQDDGSFIIGLWGMGGSGKTTLVKEVGKKAKESLIFDRVVLTTISQSVDIRKTQGEIADTLGIKLEEESETGRAKRIALRLHSGERILIILDDAWSKLNLEDIGIQSGGNQQRSCKVVLTTRRLDVCTLMECKKTIHLDLLNPDDAWNLFQNHANVDNANKEVVARLIAKECKGLPIAIEAVGTCLKGKGIDEMKAMLHKLKNAKPISNEVDKGVRDAFTCLALSYDYLANEEAKLLLLMCAMFPEDHIIDGEDLFRYGVGLGLYRDVESFDIARSEVRMTINRLIDCSLLMRPPKFDQGTKQYVAMHDVVRDFALWKASQEDRTIMVNCDEKLNELTLDAKLRDCYAVSSWYDNNKLLQFLSQLDAPKLEFLLLRLIETLDISHASFEGTKQIKALIIMGQYRDLANLCPQPIQHLSNLQTLRLQHCDLGDISFVVSLTRLKILDLRGSKFERVPNGIEKLNKLNLLDLSSCTIEKCCYRVIELCLQLEELYVPRHSPHSKKENCYECLAGPIALMKLRTYNLEIGEFGQDLDFENKGMRSLHLGQLNISTLGAIIKDLAQRATAIRFFDLHGGGKSFITNIVQGVGGMKELTKLCLYKCSEIECIMDKTTPHEDVVVPILDELVLECMGNLKQLCRGHSPFSLFQKLERLKIFNCPQLVHIFPADCNLGNLKLLNISRCPMLTSLFPVSAACTLLSLETLQISYCSELKHVFERGGGGDAWENSRFPKLKTLSVWRCDKLEYVCPVFLAERFVQLQRLSIGNAPEMKVVFGEYVGEEQPMYDQDKTLLVLPLLDYLELQNLPNLVGICSERYDTSWPSIKTIEWKDCPNMELQELEGYELRNDEYKQLAAIERITLRNCKAESIFHYQTGVGEQIAKFQYLRELTLEKCARLKFVFSAHICQSLPELITLTISRCDELEAIFLENEEGQKNLSITESCLVKLKSLEISECNKLKFVLSFMVSAATSLLPQLSTLTISDCSQMEEIFKCSNIEDHDSDNEREIRFPNMKDMELKNLPRLVNVCQGFKFHTGEFCRVDVRDCPKLMPIMTATIRWTKGNLVRYYRLKYSQLNNKEALNLPISVLIPGELDVQSAGVKHSWKVIGDDDQEENNSSVMLRSEQQMLGGLVPTQVMSFQYLDSLEVTNIKKLKFLFSVSTIVQNSLPKLNSLTLSDCEELEMIFGHSSEDDAKYGETIVMSSLTSVCQVGLQVQVELSHISIIKCPKFVDSSLGWAFQQLGAISLPQVSSTEDSNLEISSNVEQLRGNEEKGMKVLISRAEQLQLEDSMNLTSVWEGPTFIMFQNLKLLLVIKCRRLKCMFPSTVIRSLPCLKYLRIEECEKLEEVMPSSSLEEEHNHFPNKSSNSSLCFPQLRDLIVKRCRKLKWLFPSLPSTLLLSQLNSLYVEECEELEEMIPSSSSSSSSSEEHNHFPNESSNSSLCVAILKRLTIIRCRKLKWLFPSLPSTLLLPQLNSLYVEECEELEEMIPSSSSSEEEHNHFPNESSNSSLCFPQLHILSIIRCRKLKWLFPSLPSTLLLPRLRVLHIEECGQLKGICNSEVEIHEEGFYFNLLKFVTIKNCPSFSETTLASLQMLEDWNQRMYYENVRMMRFLL